MSAREWDDPSLALDPPSRDRFIALGAPPRVDPHGYAVLSDHPETACRQMLALMKETP